MGYSYYDKYFKILDFSAYSGCYGGVLDLRFFINKGKYIDITFDLYLGSASFDFKIYDLIACYLEDFDDLGLIFEINEDTSNIDEEDLKYVMSLGYTELKDYLGIGEHFADWMISRQPEWVGNSKYVNSFLEDKFGYSIGYTLIFGRNDKGHIKAKFYDSYFSCADYYLKLVEFFTNHTDLFCYNLVDIDVKLTDEQISMIETYEDSGLMLYLAMILDDITDIQDRYN